MQLQRFYNYSWTKRRAALRRRWILLKAKLGGLIGRSKDRVDVVPIEIDRSGTPILGLSLKDASDFEICNCDVELSSETARRASSLCQGGLQRRSVAAR